MHMVAWVSVLLVFGFLKVFAFTLTSLQSHPVLSLSLSSLVIGYMYVSSVSLNAFDSIVEEIPQIYRERILDIVSLNSSSFWDLFWSLTFIPSIQKSWTSSTIHCHDMIHNHL